MSDTGLTNDVKRHRERLGLSQLDLAALVGVSRQAIVGIEGARQVPSTTLSLRLAHALGCGIHDLFRLRATEGLSVRIAPRSRAMSIPTGARVAIAEVGGAWVAHRLPDDGTVSADGIVTAGDREQTAVTRPFAEPEVLRRNVLVCGCAPILGLVAQRVGDRFSDARATWLSGGSHRSLDLLESGLVHIAGVHLPGGSEGHEALIRARFAGQRMLVVNLTRWREGFVVRPGNPLGIRRAEDLLRERLRFARREEGAGARRLVDELLQDVGAAGSELTGPEAGGHVEVAQLVRCGAADVGVAIEGVALAADLDFVPLAEERFDLVVPASVAGEAPVARFLDSLDEPSFRMEMAHVPGYDTGLSGHVTTLDAA